MLITKRTYKRKYVIGALVSSISAGTFFARIFSSNAAKQLASAALQAGRTAAKDIGMKDTTQNHFALTLSSLLQTL